MLKFLVKLFLVFGLFQGQSCFCSFLFSYEPCGEESAAFMKIIPLLSARETFPEGYNQLDELVKKGDPQAFLTICDIHRHCSPDKYIPYINDTRRHLVEQDNAEALARMGKVLIDLDKPVAACHFLREAITRKDRLSSVKNTLEDTEYNYAFILCNSAPLLRTDQFDPFAESWEILKSCVYSKDHYFTSLEMMLFDKLKNTPNQDALINKIGHCLMDQQSTPEALRIYSPV